MLVRFSRGLAAVFFSQVIVAAGNLLLVPLYLAHWPPVVYGEWLVLTSLVGYLSALDLGMNIVVVNRLTQAYAKGDLSDYSRCQHSAMALYLITCSVASLLIVIVIGNFPLPNWVGLKETPVKEASWVIGLIGFNILWTIPLGFIGAVYRTTGNLARSQWIGNIQQLMVLSIVAMVLMRGGGMRAVAAWQLIPLMFVTVYVIWDLRHRFPELVPGIRHASMTVIRGLIKPSLLFGLFLLAAAISQQGSVLVVSTALGGVAAATFIVSRTLANLIRQVVGSISNAIWPELTRLEALGEWNRLRGIYRWLLVGTTTLSIGLAVTLWYEGAEIIRVWTLGKLEPDTVLLRLLLILLVVQSPWLVSFALSASANRHALLSRLSLIASVVGIGVAFFLVQYLGVWAVPIGLLIGEALTCYHFVIKDTCRIIGEPYGVFAWWLWPRLATVGALTLVVGWIAHEAIPGQALVRWACVGILTLSTSLIGAWYCWLMPEDRAELMVRLQPFFLAIEGKVRLARY